MNEDFFNLQQYGFIISKIHGNATSLLTESDYSSLQQSDNLEDVLVKLSSYSKHITEGMPLTKKEFSKRLNLSLKEDFMMIYKNSQGSLKKLLDYFIDTYKIQNFFFLLLCKNEDNELKESMEKIEMLGYFNELDTLKIANDMPSVYKYCVESTFLKKYYDRVHFDKEINKNDFQVIQSLFFKYHIEDFYEMCSTCSCMEYMKEILKFEGDRKIIEIVLNTFNSTELIDKKREFLFPKVSSMNMGMIKKLSICTSLDEMRGILGAHSVLRKIVSAEDDEILGTLLSIEMKKYVSSFCEFNDLSCVYSYFRMKEQEIKNILWIIECISQNKREYMGTMLTPEMFNDK